MILTAVVEIPMNSTFKYEIDKSTGQLCLDRPLNQPIPYNYGFIPGTLSEDSDPIDVFVLTDTPIHPLTKVSVQLIGVIKGEDGGKRDDKLIATIVGDCRGYETMGLAVIQSYLESYKTGFKILGPVGDAVEAAKIYDDSVKLYESNIWRDEDLDF